MDNENTERKSKNRAPIVVLGLGLVALIGGAVFFALNAFSGEALSDADYLVSVGKWAREDAGSVVWDFTEVGEGSLTTNGHLNDYDFIWALEDGQLKMETKWLEDLEDEFSYTLDQNARKLTLVADGDEWVFVPAE